jgi:hypothetical protein
MGNVLRFLLTGLLPFNTERKAQKVVPKGILPKIPREKRYSKSFVDQTMIKAIEMCMKADPKERATARQVADFLQGALRTYSRGVKKAK